MYFDNQYSLSQLFNIFIFRAFAFFVEKWWTLQSSWMRLQIGFYLGVGGGPIFSLRSI